MTEAEGGNSTDPNTKQTLFKNALAYFDEGIRAYTEVKRLRPDHPDVARNFSVVYRDRGKLLGQRMGLLKESIASIEKSLEYSKKHFESFRLLGVAYGMTGVQLQQQGRAAEGMQSHYKAINYFEQALEMVPNSVPILFNLEVAYRQLGDVDKINEYHNRWYELDPNYDPSKQQ
jgi:tetratricopeptide (TPR) repeat protein